MSETFKGIVDKESEEWKTIPDFPNYRCSNYGRVISLSWFRWSNRPGEISQNIDRYGYWRLCLYKNGKQYNFTTHKLVAKLFIGNCPDGYQINHKDGDKLNPKYDNLEYVTISQNVRHALKLGLKTGRVFTEEEIKTIVELNKKGCSYRSIAKELNSHHWRISKTIVEFENYLELEALKRG